MDRRTFLKIVAAGAGSATLNAAFGQDTTATQLTSTSGPASGTREATAAGGGLFSNKVAIAHRGASAYMPENTLPAYRLAIKQGATLVEQDLNITKDGVLACIHDGSLEATTDVEQVFPDRFTMKTVKGQQVKTWMISDFTVAEIKTLKAGFRNGQSAEPTTIPTWQEAIDEIRGKAGLCPETKSESYYAKLGFQMEKLVADQLRKNGLDKPGADSRTPVLMQSFSKDSITRLAENGIRLPMIWLQTKGAKNLSAFIPQAVQLGYAALGPFKDDITAEFVQAAHKAGVNIITYTYEASSVKQGFPDMKAEMSNHLYELGIDGHFTNNPDLFPRR
jgi:glycerophosphoryl diester phosphodiesterase